MRSGAMDLWGDGGMGRGTYGVMDQALNPFSVDDFSDDEINECVRNIEGNRMSLSGLCGGANIEVQGPFWF